MNLELRAASLGGGMASQPARVALSTLRCLAGRAGERTSGRAAGSLAGLRPSRPAPLGSPLAAAFSSGSRNLATAAAGTDVATPEQAAAAAPCRDGVYQSQAYPFTDIEAKWQAYWEEHKTFRTPDFHELDTSKPKFYALDMFPYPRCARWAVVGAGRQPRWAHAGLLRYLPH